MKNKSIVEEVRNYCAGSKSQQNESAKIILEMMNPLIQGKVRKIPEEDREDMIQELQIAVLESIKKMKVIEYDGACVKYIQKAVEYQFLKVCRDQKKLNRDEEHFKLNILSESIVHQIEDVDFKMDFCRALENFSDCEKEMLLLIAEGASDKEISEKMNISRQYINRHKKCCMKKIMKSLGLRLEPGRKEGK